MQLVLFCGIQATGKTTFYQQQFLHTHVRLGLDLLRTRHREQQFLQLCLATGMRCVIDNTNPTRAERASYLAPARAAGFEVVGYFFGRKLRKYQSVLAGEASAAFSLQLGAVGAFDCRVAQLPRRQDVVDYFRWRQEDAGRNALNAHCYWLLRGRGESVAEATARVAGQSTAAKHELLFSYGINFHHLPAWQKRGLGVYWEDYQKTGFDPRTQTPVEATRRRLTTNLELPLGPAYETFVCQWLPAPTEQLPAPSAPSNIRFSF